MTLEEAKKQIEILKLQRKYWKRCAQFFEARAALDDLKRVEYTHQHISLVDAIERQTERTYALRKEAETAEQRLIDLGVGP